jgi:hypothetical protein
LFVFLPFSRSRSFPLCLIFFSFLCRFPCLFISICSLYKYFLSPFLSWYLFHRVFNPVFFNYPFQSFFMNLFLPSLRMHFVLPLPLSFLFYTHLLIPVRSNLTDKSSRGPTTLFGCGTIENERERERERERVSVRSRSFCESAATND